LRKGSARARGCFAARLSRLETLHLNRALRLNGSEPAIWQLFVIQNNSLYGINQMVSLCGLGWNSNLPFRSILLSSADEDLPVLAPGAKTTLSCPIDTDASREFNIDPQVRFKLPGGISQCWMAHFSGVRGASQYVWRHRGAESCAS